MYLQFPAQIGITIALLVLSVTFVPASHAQSLPEIAQTSLAEIDYQTLRKRVEQIEKKDVYQLGAEEIKQKIETAATDLEAYIDANDTDVNAMILFVRLGFIEEIFVKGRGKDNAQTVNPEGRFAPLHQRLDRVLELDNNNAKANYWKARLYGMKTQAVDSQGNAAMQPIDLEQAIYHARKAVQLDKKNVWYREALAVYHITNGDRKSALKVLDTVLTTFNPVNILLKDIDAFPLPEGTVYLQKDTETYSELQIKQKTISDFPQLRSQVFAVPMTASRLEEFFQDKWPQFRFFKQGKNLQAQYLIFDPELRPTKNIREARAWAQQERGGIILSVMDVKNATAAERDMSPEGQALPASLGDNFSYVFYVNNRKVD